MGTFKFLTYARGGFEGRFDGGLEAVDALRCVVLLSSCSILKLFLMPVLVKEVVSTGGGVLGGGLTPWGGASVNPARGGDNSKGVFCSSERARFTCMLNYWAQR